MQDVASRVLQSKRMRLLIAGHTHFPRVGTRGWLRYLNTGTWLPVGGLSDGPIDEILQKLRAEPHAAPAPCTFAEVRWEGERLHARLGRVERNGDTVWLEPVIEVERI